MNYNTDSQNNPMKDEEEDDWNPEITKKDSILNKVVVNFTSLHFIFSQDSQITLINILDKAIKKKNLEEEELEDAIFQDIQKKTNEEEDGLNPRQLDDSDDNEDNLMFDKAQIKENMKSYMKGENLYDPLSDFKEEEWVKKNLSNFFYINEKFLITQI